MKYEFSLQVVLEHRKRSENEARRAFLEAQAKVDAAVAELNEFYEQVDQTRADSLALQRRGGTASPSLVANENFVTGQKFRIDAQRMKIRDLKIEAEVLQDALLEAAKEVKTLEKLKERQADEFKKKRRVHEAREIDEIVTLRHKNQV